MCFGDAGVWAAVCEAVLERVGCVPCMHVQQPGGGHGRAASAVTSVNTEHLGHEIEAERVDMDEELTARFVAKQIGSRTSEDRKSVV